MKKKISKVILGLLLSIIALFLIIVMYVVVVIFLNRNEWLETTKAKYPLDKEHIYMILQNIGSETVKGAYIPNTFYILTPLETSHNKNKNLNYRQDSILGLQIGTETKFDFTPYLNQPIYIEGEFYEGYPIKINLELEATADVDLKRINENSKRILLRIDEITLAN